MHFIIGKLRLEDMNGVSSVVHSLANAQAITIDDVQVWGLVNSVLGIDKDVEQRKYQLLTYKRDLYKIYSNHLYKAIKKISKENVCFHLHGAWNLEMHITAYYLHRYNIPYILTAHGGFNENIFIKKTILKRIYFKLIIGKYLINAKKVHLYSEVEYEFLSKYFDNINPLYLPNGINCNDFCNNGQKFSNHDPLVFGYVGRLDKYSKGLDVLISGFAKYIGSGGNGVLWIVGDGPDKNDLAFEVENLGITSKTKFWGSQFGEKKNDILLNMDSFVLASMSEGMPIAVLEAACFGKFLIVSKNTNLGKYINSYGVGKVLSSNSSESLSLLMKEFEYNIKENKAQFMKENLLKSKKMIEKEFRWEIIAKAFLKEYKQIIEE